MHIVLSRKRLLFDWIFGISLFAFIKPEYLNQIAWTDILCNFIQIAAFLTLIIYHCFVLKHVSKITILFVVYVTVPVANTLVNAGDYYTAFLSVFRIVGVSMLLCSVGEREPLRLLRILTLIMETLIYINLLTIILFPGGLYHYSTLYGWQSDKVWVFGLRNIHPQFLMFTCFCSALNLYFSSNTRRDILRFIAVNIAMVWTIYLLESGGGYTMLAVYVILMMAYVCFKHFPIPFEVIVVLHLFGFIAITMFSATYLFEDFFALFGKNGSATGRTRIWAAVLERIVQKPLFGFGIMRSEDLHWLQWVAAGATSAHNMMMDVLFRGGIVTLTLFIGLLIRVGKRIRMLITKASLYNLASIFFCSFFVVYQSEGGFMSTALYMIICLIWLMPNFEEQSQSESVLRNQFRTTALSRISK